MQCSIAIFFPWHQLRLTAGDSFHHRSIEWCVHLLSEHYPLHLSKHLVSPVLNIEGVGDNTVCWAACWRNESAFMLICIRAFRLWRYGLATVGSLKEAAALLGHVAGCLLLHCCTFRCTLQDWDKWSERHTYTSCVLVSSPFVFLLSCTADLNV